jgi:tRNA(adenine34) deaminase
MGKALAQARKAALIDEVPIGCVIVQHNRIIARAHNLRETRQDPAAHAELLAIRQAARKLGSWRLLDSTLYVTLEPCLMCMGAIILARIPLVVFGCYDPKAGAAGSLYDLSDDCRLNHQVQLITRIREKECSGILSGFFTELRRKRRSGKGQG